MMKHLILESEKVQSIYASLEVHKSVEHNGHESRMSSAELTGHMYLINPVKLGFTSFKHHQLLTITVEAYILFHPFSCKLSYA